MFKIVSLLFAIIALSLHAWGLWEDGRTADFINVLIVITALSILTLSVYFETYGGRTRTKTISLDTLPSRITFELSKTGEEDGEWILAGDVPRSEHHLYPFYRVRTEVCE